MTFGYQFLSLDTNFEVLVSILMLLGGNYNIEPCMTVFYNNNTKVYNINTINKYETLIT